MKFRRWLALAAGIVAVPVLLAAAALLWVYSSQAGSRLLLTRALAASGGALTVGSVEGSFRDAIVLTDLMYRDSAQEARIDRLSLRLGLGGLLTGILVVDDLRSSVIRYRALATAPPRSPAAPLSLPITIRVDRAAIEGISIARADGTLELERIVLAGAAEATTAYLQRFEIRTLGFFLSMQGGIAWSDGLAVDGLISWSGEIGERDWLGSAEVDGSWPRFQIDQELLEPFAQAAAGTVELGAAPSFDLSIRWPGLGNVNASGGLDADSGLWRADLSSQQLDPAAIVPAWPGLWRLDGSVTAAIDEGYRIATEGLHLEGELREHLLVLDLAGAYAGSQAIEIQRAAITLGDNRAEVEGSVGESLDLRVRAQLDDLSGVAALAAEDEIRSLSELAGLATALTGRASADLRLGGSLSAPLASGTLRVEDSEFAELPLEFALDFAAPRGDDAFVRLEQLEGRLGATRLAGQGRIGSVILEAPADWRSSDAALEFAFELAAADLGELATLSGREEVQALLGDLAALPPVSGSAAASLRLSGSPRRPRLDGSLGLTDFAFDRIALAAASLDLSAGLYPGATASLALDVTAAAGSARLEAEGTVTERAFSGTVNALQLDEQWLGRWDLQAPVALTVGPGRVELENACVVHRNSGICGEWHFGGANDGLSLSARDFDLAVLNPLLPATVSLSGPVSLDASLDLVTGAPVGSLHAETGVIDVAIAMSDTDSVTTGFTSVSVDAELTAYALQAEASLQSRTLGRADINLMTADVRDDAAPIGGRIDVLWPDLSALSLLSPDVGEVGGTLALAIELGGSARSPELSGSGQLTGGRVAIPEWGILVERIEGEALSAEGRSLRYEGSGFIEDSEVFLTGRTELDPAANWPTRLSLTGDRVPVARRPDATVFASPEFDIDIRLPRIDVNGSVLIPEADLSVEELPGQAVRVSPDSVIHGAAASEAVRPLELTALVSVELGDDVRYTGSNLDTRLSGGLAMEYISGRSPIAGGSVKLAGTYQAYGQTLNLERGELLFAGPLNDPAIDVLAAKTVGQTTVGVRVTGTLQSPTSSLYSDPRMSDLNALSYLMFNRPAGSENDEDATALEAAAFALGVQQALPVVQRVGETLRLDELSIASTEIDAGSLMAGKYLSPKLYLSYTYGLFNRLGGFLLRYDINDRLSLETRSGNEKAMDLLYSIEKD